MRRAEAPTSAIDVSRETWERMDAYVALLEKWTVRINLISRSSVPLIWERHIADSCQLAEFISSDKDLWVDLGSGGGMPGLVVAIIAREKAPGFRMKLVESDQRKATFLRTVVRELDLNATVEATRIEELAPQETDIISARALARLPQLLEYVERHRRSTGKALFLKGISFEKEVEESRKTWHFDLEIRPSLTDPQAALLVIGELSRV